MKILDKNKIQRFNILDISLIKLAMVGITLFVITIWSAAMTWVQSINPWIFLAAGLTLGAIPFYKFYLKRGL